MYMSFCDEGVIIRTSQMELDTLNSELKEKLFKNCSFIADDFSKIIVKNTEKELAYEVDSEIRRMESNAQRSERRGYVEMSQSPGYYTSADIK